LAGRRAGLAALDAALVRLMKPGGRGVAPSLATSPGIMRLHLHVADIRGLVEATEPREEEGGGEGPVEPWMPAEFLCRT